MAQDTALALWGGRSFYAAYPSNWNFGGGVFSVGYTWLDPSADEQLVSGGTSPAGVVPVLVSYSAAASAAGQPSSPLLHPKYQVRGWSSPSSTRHGSSCTTERDFLNCLKRDMASDPGCRHFYLSYAWNWEPQVSAYGWVPLVTTPVETVGATVAMAVRRIDATSQGGSLVLWM
jgi:hypothetical protein